MHVVVVAAAEGAVAVVVAVLDGAFSDVVDAVHMEGRGSVFEEDIFQSDMVTVEDVSIPRLLIVIGSRNDVLPIVDDAGANNVEFVLAAHGSDKRNLGDSKTVAAFGVGTVGGGYSSQDDAALVKSKVGVLVDVA